MWVEHTGPFCWLSVNSGLEFLLGPSIERQEDSVGSDACAEPAGTAEPWKGGASPPAALQQHGMDVMVEEVPTWQPRTRQEV